MGITSGKNWAGRYFKHLNLLKFSRLHWCEKAHALSPSLSSIALKVGLREIVNYLPLLWLNLLIFIIGITGEPRLKCPPRIITVLLVLAHLNSWNGATFSLRTVCLSVELYDLRN